MSVVTGDSRLQSDVLEDLSDARRYRRWLADLASPHLGDHPLEVGSGLGDYIAEYLPTVRSITATEGDESRLDVLRTRFADDPRVTVAHLHLPADADEAVHTAAVAYNVLEHIPDDRTAVKSLAGFVRPGGALVLLVPAFPSAMSRFDRAIGHQRRYTRQSFGEVLASAGLAVEVLRYVNPVGLLTWYAGAKALRMTPRNGPALRAYDATVVPVARLVDHLHVPFGQSVFAVARVP